MPEIQFVLMFV